MAGVRLLPVMKGKSTMKSIFYLPFTFILFNASLSYPQQRQLTLESPQSEQRVALVIGNSAYETAPLKNPVNDAQDIAQALRELGFEVIYRENLDQNNMKRAIRAFGEKIRHGEIGLFYYAGHGVQVKGENYLVPIGAKVDSEEEVEYEGVNAGFVLAQMEKARNSMNIVILDACRNNPFARSFRSESRGLAVMNAPSGVLIAYATAPGSVASDGSARNGVYTQELLKFMRTPNLGIEEVFKRVRISVRSLTQGRQTPWEASSLVGDFYFLKGEQLANAVIAQPTAPSVDPVAIELSYWDTIKNSINPEDFKAYLREYPNGRFVNLAKNRLSSIDTGSGEKTVPAKVEANNADQVKSISVRILRGFLVQSGTLYISPSKVEYIDKDKPNDNLSFSCSDIKEVKQGHGRWSNEGDGTFQIITESKKYNFEPNYKDRKAVCSWVVQAMKNACKIGQ
jgi:hypothetical protein